MSRPASLGNIYGVTGQSACEHGEHQAFTKWQLQETACRLLPKTRITACHRVIANQEHGVAIRADSEKAWFAGLAACGSVWSCPVCARKVGEYRRDELQRAIDSAVGQGLGVALVTQTFSHGIRDNLGEILTKMAEARSKMTSWSSWKKLKKRYQVEGSIRALEVTHGANGWHPHTHEIYFFKYGLDTEKCAELQREIFPIWRLACEKVGLALPNAEHGVDVRGASRAAQYVGKWGFASELTRSTSKTAWAGRNPWQMLTDYHTGDKQAGALFVEYSEAFKGRCQLRWSRGLRDLLKIGEMFSDEELAALDDFSNPDEVVTVVHLDSTIWALICRLNARGEVLKIARGEKQQLEGWLDNIREKVPIRWMQDDLAVNAKMQRVLKTNRSE